MTRDEISEQAARLATAMMLKQLSRSGANDVIETATDKMVDFYRATLNEAARAVCPMCREHYDVGRDEGGYWVHDPFGGPEPVYSECKAPQIHELIRSLDSE